MRKQGTMLKVFLKITSAVRGTRAKFTILAECFKEGKNHAFSLGTSLLRHSLLLYENPYNRRDWMTTLTTWVTLRSYGSLRESDC